MSHQESSSNLDTGFLIVLALQAGHPISASHQHTTARLSMVKNSRGQKQLTA